MQQKLILAASCPYLRAGQHFEKLLKDKRVFPLGSTVGFLTPSSDIQVKFYNSDQYLVVATEAKITRIKETFCLKLTPETFEGAVERLLNSDYLVIVVEGSVDRAALLLCFLDQRNNIFETLQVQNPSLRLEACDLPPAEVTEVNVPDVKAILYTALAKNEPELFSVSAQRFLATPHILTHLFAQVMSLASADNISYISTLRVIADQLRSLLKSRIRKITKDHQKLWSEIYGDQLSFLDGGVSRVVGLPGTEPMGIRIGIYTVTPGERDSEKREK